MDYSRLIADFAAERLQAVGRDALTLLDLLSAPTSSTGATRRTEAGSVNTDQIGLWSKRAGSNGVSYVRADSRSSADWRLARERWADVEIIPPKSKRRRIILLGESVARGYFYDPLYTPASVLQTLLERHLPEGAEVIDLAANDLSSSELLELLFKAPALSPDALVIFAGNNWTPAPLHLTLADGSARHQAAAALRAGGVPALKCLLEDRVSYLVSEQLRMLPRALQAMRIPAVLVVPEFNLVDWHEDPGNNAPWLSGAANRQWWDHHLRARRALEENDPRLAREHAEALLALDGGLAHNGLEIMGKVLAAVGEHAQARVVLERARDGRIWDIAVRSPRCHASIQNGLRRAASEQVRIVDLPEIFCASRAHRLPDRSVFMDYCHLSAASIALAMANVAQAVVPDVTLPPPDVLCNGPGIRVAPEVESNAHFLAAIHNAHWGQSRDIIRHHVRIAAQSSGSRDMLGVVLNLHGRRAPAWMTPGAAAILEGQGPQLARYPLGYDRRRFFDEHLLDVIAETLEQHGDESASRRLATRRKNEWSVQSCANRVDLLAPFWTHHADQCRPRREHWHGAAGVSPLRSWYRVYTPISGFPVICATSSALDLEITQRQSRFFEPDGECRVKLNGAHVGAFPLPPQWRTCRIEIPASHVRSGVNTLELLWPLGHWQSAAAIEAAAAGLELGRLLDLSPAFADLWSLWVQQSA
jgi:hypothetical protein